MGISYKEAGVDIKAARDSVARIKEIVKPTFNSEVLSGLGGFAGLYAPDLTNYEEPVLVSGTDGVGTKLKIAFKMDKHQTIGIDLVAMCVNDILAQGAKPLFFLDYLATGKLKPEIAAEIVSGIAEGCKRAGCALIGGETAELPGFYGQGEYDLAGFAVGIVDRKDIISGEDITTGDRIIGLAADGIHSNGYSLVRKVLLEKAGFKINRNIDKLGGKLGDILLKPTRIYVRDILSLLEKYNIKGIAHITGGGLQENIARVLPEKTEAVIERGSWPVLDIFKFIQDTGEIETAEMFHTFNMGIGMVIVVPEENCKEIISELKKENIESYNIGKIVSGEGEVEIR